MQFRKYEFSNWETVKASLQQTDEEGNVSWVSSVNSVVELGNLCTQWGTDEEGMPVCEATNPKYSVDILWNQLDESLNDSIVWPEPCGIHIFGGWEKQYEQDYCTANPDAAYCQTPEPPAEL